MYELENESLLDYLTKGKERLPISYRFIEKVDISESITRSESNKFYNANRLAVGNFYKPITHIHFYIYEE